MLLRTASHSESRRYYLTMLWSAKEAIKKSSHMQPLPGFLEITLCSIDKIDENGFHLRFKLNKQKGDTFYNVFALPYLSSAIALTLNTEDFPCSR